MKTGNFLIDNDHRSLGRLLDRLDERADAPEHTADFYEILSMISATLTQHFDNEEAVFTISEMPENEIASHLHSHFAIMTQVTLLNFELMQGTEYERKDIARQLRQWFEAHLIEHDTKLHDLLAECA